MDLLFGKGGLTSEWRQFGIRGINLLLIGLCVLGKLPCTFSGQCLFGQTVIIKVPSEIEPPLHGTSGKTYQFYSK